MTVLRPDKTERKVNSRNNFVEPLSPLRDSRSDNRGSFREGNDFRRINSKKIKQNRRFGDQSRAIRGGTGYREADKQPELPKDPLEGTNGHSFLNLNEQWDFEVIAAGIAVNVVTG